MIIKINALALLFIMQFLLIFIALAVVFYRRFKKEETKAAFTEVSIRRLRHEIAQLEHKSDEESGWKKRFGNLQSKFDIIKKHNEKLKKSIDALVPEAERTKEYRQVIGDIEESYVELDSFLRDLKKEKLQLAEKAQSLQSDVDKLSSKQEETVSKAEYDNLLAEKHGVELRAKKLQQDLEDKTQEHASLEKNYVWLEKEYNALYENASKGIA